MNPQPNTNDRLERATRDRLARLADAPVEVSDALARFRATVALESQVQQPESQPLRIPIWRRTSAWAAMAATFMLVATSLFLLINLGPSPVQAAPAEMVQLHRDLIAGKAPVIPVENIMQARRTIESQWEDAPSLPQLPDENIHACCLRGVQSRQVACILLRHGGAPVTVIVAKTKDFKSSEGPMVTRNGHEFSVQSRDGINMVMTQHEDRWLCFMSELNSDELVQLAQRVAFENRN